MDRQLEADAEQGKARDPLAPRRSATRRRGRCRDLTESRDRARPRPALPQASPSGDASGSAAPYPRAPARPVASRTEPVRSCSVKRARKAGVQRIDMGQKHGLLGLRGARRSATSPARRTASRPRENRAACGPSPIRERPRCGFIAFWAKRARDFFSFSSASRHRALHGSGAVVEPQIERKLAGHCRACSIIAAISASVTGPRSSGSGTVTPVAVADLPRPCGG